jgi:hypothetical protein
LAGKKSPMYIQDRLNGFLRPEVQDYFGANVRLAARPIRLKVVSA